MKSVRNVRGILSFVLIAVGVWGCAGSQIQTNQIATTTTEDTYAIGSGDVLTITTWKEPDFSGDFLVRSDGAITFPLLHDIYVAGLSPAEVRAQLESSLQDYVSDAVVTVAVKEATSHKFYVVGEVNEPGEYDLVKDLSVIQALAIAGGFTEWAKKDQIVLLRKEGEAEKAMPVSFMGIVTGKVPNYAINSGDTIVVP